VTDAELMALIRTRYGAQLAAACHPSSLPEAFLAAVVANESGGNPAAARPEPAVFTRLVNVAAGHQALFSCPGIRKPLSATDLLAYASPGELQPSQIVAEYQGPPFMPYPLGTGTEPLPGSPMPGAPARGLQWGLKRLGELATSWGLTQIMGWHLIEMAGYAGFRWTVGDLADAGKNLLCAVALFTYFGEHYQLDPVREFEQLLRCWNTGTPDGATFDPMYVQNGLARMAAYSGLALAAPTPGAQPPAK